MRDTSHPSYVDLPIAQEAGEARKEQTGVRKRTGSLTLLAIVLLLVSPLELIAGGVTLGTAFKATQGMDVPGMIVGSCSLLIGLLAPFFAWGVWKLKRWAFWLTVVLVSLLVVRHIGDFIRFEFIQRSPSVAIWTLLAGLLLPLAIWFAYSRSRQRWGFQRRRAPKG